MMAKKPEDRPASMTEVIALLQASKLSAASDMGTVAPSPPAPTSVAEVRKQALLERSGPSRPITESAIFARRIESEEINTDSKLKLWDLLMDVRSDVNVAGEPGADEDERASTSDDHELNLRELAMSLGEEAAAPAARKPPVAEAPSPKGSAPPRKEDKPSALAETAFRPRPALKRSAPPQRAETPSASPKPPSAPAQPLKRSAPPQRAETPSASPKPPSAPAQPLKRSAPPQRAEMPAASPKPPSAPAQPLRRSAPPQYIEAPPDRPQSPADERQRVKPAAPVRSGGLAQSKGLVILAVVMTVLLIVAVVVSFSGRPESVMNEDTSAPAHDSKENGNSPDEALPPPV